ncbi:MAG TPA: hypothetical protein VFY41_09340 [Nitrososphaeraceae archaeon]|nr:hypothetical protein [Nitrososphaeraceae archaeon]
MGIEQILQNEVYESQRALNGPNDNTIYRRDHSKRIEILNRVLENMKNPNIQICAVIESKMNEIIDAIKEKHSIIEQDPLVSELRILDWIFYQVCSNKIKKFERT